MQTQIIRHLNTYFQNYIILMSVHQSVFQSLHFQKNILPLVGVLRCIWHNAKHKAAMITYGTAIVISPRVLLTCTHNLYSQTRGTVCSEAQFIPGVQEGLLSTNKIYSISYKQSFKYKLGISSFQIKPIAQQVALMLLDKPINNHQDIIYPKISTLESQYSKVGLKIVGYPSQNYYSTFKLHSAYAQRKQLNGFIHDIDMEQSIINHTMMTSIGFSGSPIFAKQPHGSYFICGIHTHRGLNKQYNSGVYFTPQVLTKLNQFFNEFKREKNLNDILNLVEADDSNVDKLTQINTKEDSERQDEEEPFRSLYSDDEKYQNLSRISCFDDLFQRQKQFQGQDVTIEAQE